MFHNLFLLHIPYYLTTFSLLEKVLIFDNDVLHSKRCLHGIEFDGSSCKVKIGIEQVSIALIDVHLIQLIQKGCLLYTSNMCIRSSFKYLHCRIKI